MLSQLLEREREHCDQDGNDDAVNRQWNFSKHSTESFMLAVDVGDLREAHIEENQPHCCYGHVAETLGCDRITVAMAQLYA